jgi:hypothetical protein
MTTEENKTISKKKEVSKRSNKLDPNNNKNLPEMPVIIKRGKKVHDDGFEHKTRIENIKPNA